MKPTRLEDEFPEAAQLVSTLALRNAQARRKGRPNRPITLNPVAPLVSAKVGRNDPCPCGSGKKYKKCCNRKEQ